MIRGLLLLSTALGIAAPALAQSHPLDPLSTDEHWRVLEILDASGRLTPKTRFTRIALSPPDKTKVVAGAKVPRVAEVRIKEGSAAVEATVDLGTGKVTGWRSRTDVQPAWLLEEFLGAPVQAVLNHPQFEAKLKARGVANKRFLNCRAMPIGSHAEPRFAGKRVAMVRCDPINGLQNRFVRRIEGLTAFVDVNTNEVLDLSDDAVIPVPATRADYDERALGKLRDFPTPISMSQPNGPSYTVDGHQVRWGNWSFHLKSDQRVGTMISRLQWHDGGKTRDVMYEGYLSEIFVPYMDPATDWYTRTLLDAGEYSMGGLSGALTRGIDCPEGATYFNGLVTGDNGRPSEKADVICLFERTTGDMSWRHAEIGRPKRELVARMIADLGNYDYVFDWVFESDGQFRVNTGATGIVAVKMAKAKDAKSAAGQAEDAYGRFVDDNVIAINHDHYFSFRLDLDVDGPTNNFVRDALVTQRLPEGHPRKSIWTAEEQVAAREADGKQVMHHGPALWRVTSGSTQNRMGYPASYQLMLGHTSGTLFSKDDIPRQRAGFIDNDLWVTPYNPDERYAAGEYAVLSAPGEGLPKWTAANRGIAGTDIVIWPTVGMHHKVRSEDWPVMPVLWHSITIRPFDFYDRNPAIDIGLKP
ncbi:hypothetical protein ACFOMD_10375 [Sphingoaurantiacus capsulatus]|uniref:Amine oxidase n=1 Tax=Sphingoaurantiacus capsulatus TaxID=1771310 RepID=A0ABV7XE98_9SPHN